jgi:hypothetical protein
LFTFQYCVDGNVSAHTEGLDHGAKKCYDGSGMANISAKATLASTKRTRKASNNILE